MQIQPIVVNTLSSNSKYKNKQSIKNNSKQSSDIHFGNKTKAKSKFFRALRNFISKYLTSTPSNKKGLMGYWFGS